MLRSLSTSFGSRPGADSSSGTNWSFWFMTAVLLVLAASAYATIEIDHPFMISSHSRALYVDEGFYSDGAQNFAKFGQWELPYDFPHWAGSPSLTLLQSATFSIFGPSLETARLISVALSLVTAFAFYGLLRMSMRSSLAALVTISSVLTFNYLAHARSALADPTAVCFSLLALLVFARVRDLRVSIPVSVAFAFLAALSKMYFVFTFAAVVGSWLIELVLVPLYTRKGISKQALLTLGASLAFIAAFVLTFIALLGDRVSQYYAINATKIPLEPSLLWHYLSRSIGALPYNTKATVYLFVILATGLTCFVLLLWHRSRSWLWLRITSLNRGELAVGAWLFAGLLVIGLLKIPKPHYYLFAILPLAFVGNVGLKLVLPIRFQTGAICLVVVLHLFHQWSFYEQWMDRPEKTAFLDASREIAQYIHEQSEGTIVPVIGEYAAQLGLFGRRIISLDAKWHPAYELCDRVAHWRPRFHVNVVWPGSVSQGEADLVSRCSQVAGVEEIERFSVFRPRQDELVLSRIYYKLN